MLWLKKWTVGMMTMKRISTIGIAAGLLAVGLAGLAALALAEVPQAGHAPLLIDGERLDFEILYGSVPAGHAYLEVADKQTAQGERLRITSVACSNDVISLFFKVEDVVVAELDASTLEPRYFEKRLREGPFKKDEWATYEAGGKVKTGSGVYEVEAGTRDILSALYYVRGQELEVGEEVRVKTFEGGKNYDARVKVLGRETVSLAGRDYDCLVVEPEIAEGPFAKTGKMLIWLTDDALKIPVLMKSKVKIGSFVARLVGSTHGEGV
jgi:hypothetical protein